MAYSLICTYNAVQDRAISGFPFHRLELGTTLKEWLKANHTPGQ